MLFPVAKLLPSTFSKLLLRALLGFGIRAHLKIKSSYVARSILSVLITISKDKSKAKSDIVESPKKNTFRFELKSEFPEFKVVLVPVSRRVSEVSCVSTVGDTIICVAVAPADTADPVTPLIPAAPSWVTCMSSADVIDGISQATPPSQRFLTTMMQIQAAANMNMFFDF